MEFEIQYQGKIKESEAIDIGSFVNLQVKVQEKFAEAQQNMIQNQNYQQIVQEHKKIKILVMENQNILSVQSQNSSQLSGTIGLSVNSSLQVRSLNEGLQIEQITLHYPTSQYSDDSLEVTLQELQFIPDQKQSYSINSTPCQMQSIEDQSCYLSLQDSFGPTLMDSSLENIKKLVIFFGFSQTGKSSVIRDLTGDTSIVCGNGNGSSTTTAVHIRKSIKPKLSDSKIFIDTIGMGDNSMKFTPEKIQQEIQSNVISLSDAEKCDEIQALIITQSLRDGAYQLPNILQNIIKIFGKLPNKSIIVLGTKSHNEDQEDVKIRQNSIKDRMRDFEIPLQNYIRFGTTYKKRNDNEIDQGQFAHLESLLAKCQKIDVKSIKEKHQRILERAKQIQVEKTEVIQHPYTHTWYQQRREGNLGKLFGIKKVKPFFQTRYHYTRHEPPMDYCLKLALEQYNNQFRKKLLLNQ